MSRFFSPFAFAAIWLLAVASPLNGTEEQQVHTLSLTSKGSGFVYSELDVSGGVMQVRGVVSKRPMEHFRLLIDGTVVYEGSLKEKVWLDTTARSSIRVEAPVPAGVKGPDVVKILVGRSVE